MALQPRDLLTIGSDSFPIHPRVHVGQGPGAMRTYDFAAGSGTVEQLTAMTQNSSGNLVPYAYIDGSFDPNTTEDIVGFCWTDAVDLDAAGEVVGTILTKGQIEAADVPLTGAGTQGQLDTALAQLALRQRDLIIVGVAVNL